MNVRVLHHVAPQRVEVREAVIAEPQPGEVLVETELTAISPGTESMIFRGDLPDGIALDDTIPSLRGKGWAYPLHYGYSLVGRVIRVGSRAEEPWLGRRVFVFHPHQDYLCVGTGECLAVPDGVSSRAATLLPNVESAINFVMDAGPLIGERFLVTGQGVVGLLTTAILAAFPLAALSAVDPIPSRLRWAETLGASVVAASVAELPAERHATDRGLSSAEGFDGMIELSGNMDALDQAISLMRFDGRIVIGSWYGRRSRALDLGGVFHRRRIRLISSQVSTIAPQLTGRWTQARRLALAWDWIKRIDPARLITHVLPVARGQEAFELAATPALCSLQVVLDYH